MTPERKISYCINFSFFCSNPVNEGHDVDVCHTCGANLLVGDRYRLIKIIEKSNADAGKRVFLALDTQNNDKLVVVKAIEVPTENLIKPLRREYEFLRSIGSPFPDIDEGAYFQWYPNPDIDFYTSHLVLPWIDGIDSLDWIREHGPISEIRCIDWILKILVYLEVMAEMSMMHRDIKPENIVVSPDEDIQLIDFGSARQIDSDYVSILEGMAFNEDGSQRVGTRVSTVGYAPREQAIGRAVMQSDYYALGKTIIYWLSGKTPANFIEEDIDNWSDACPGISKTFINFVDWLTGDKVGQRPVNASVIRQYLEERYPIDIEGEKLLKAKKKSFFFYFRIPILFLLGLGALSFIGSEYLYFQGMQSLDGDDYNRAISEFTTASYLNPLTSKSQEKIGLACFAVKDYDCSEKIFQQLSQKKPKDSFLLYQLGLVYDGMERFDEAEQKFHESLQSEPIQIESYLRLARIEINLGNLDEASMHLQNVEQNIIDYPAKNQPHDKAVLNYYLGWLKLKQGRYKSAQIHLNESLQSFSDSDLTIADGDILCLLAEAETQAQESLSTLFGSWSGCFQSVTKTPEGVAIRDQKIQSSLKNSSE